MVDAKEVVIWSADVDERTLRAALTEDCPLELIKLDRAGLLLLELDSISWVQDLGFKVFADAKITEVPDKVVKIAELHLQHKPWMLNVMAGISSSGHLEAEDPKKIDALKRFADLCHEYGTKPCAVTVLTSKSDDMVAHEFRRTPVEQVLIYVEMLLVAGFTDVVCSPLEAAAIRDESRFDGLDINTPSVRLPGSSTHDQNRVDTPAQAIANGADRVVIGRDLTDGDLLENFERIATHLNT